MAQGAAAAAPPGPPGGWAKWRPRNGAHLDELEQADNDCHGWVRQPIVVRNLSDHRYTLVAEHHEWGAWAQRGELTVLVTDPADPGFECQGCTVVTAREGSAVHPGMQVTAVAGRDAGGAEDVQGRIQAAAPCEVTLCVALAPPRQLEPWSVHTAVAEGHRWAPTGSSGYFVYRSEEAAHEVCCFWDAPALWRRSTGAAAGPPGADWAAQWKSGGLWEQMRAGGVGPEAMPSAAPVACLTAYHATGGREVCFVLEPPGAAPAEEEPASPAKEKPAQGGGGVVDPTFYEVLGVEPGCSEGAIRKGYYRKAQRWHPDKNSGDKEAEAQFKKIGHAYAVLTDPERRRLYDKHGADWMKRQEEQGGRGAVMRDSVDAMLGSGTLKEDVGDWEVLRQVDPQFAAERSRPEAMLKREQDIRNAERIKALAAGLDARMQRFVDNERRWWLELRSSLRKKAQATPGSGEVVRLVGYAYRQTARQSMTRCCGMQSALEFQKECCHGCGRDCVLVCKYVSLAKLQHWQQSWQSDLDKLDRLAEEIAAGAPGRPAADLAAAVEREAKIWRRRQSSNEDDVEEGTLVLLRDAQAKVQGDDKPGAAEALRNAAAQQRNRIEVEYQKRLTVAGLSMLYVQGSTEAEEVVRKAARLWLRQVRHSPDFRRGAAQTRRMLLALELMGDAYMQAGELGEAVDFDDAASKVASS